MGTKIRSEIVRDRWKGRGDWTLPDDDKCLYIHCGGGCQPIVCFVKVIELNTQEEPEWLHVKYISITLAEKIKHI